MSAVMTAVTAYSVYSANERADSLASAQNASNKAAHARSLELSEKNVADRKEELLRRFGISSGKMKDTEGDIFQATSVKLTALEMDIAKAKSVTDNTLASKHITGRLAERMNNAIAIQGDMTKGNILQDSEAQIKDLGNKLETLTTNNETEMMNLDIDLSNSINAADNALVAGTAYSSSSGLGGVVAAGVTAYARS